MQSSPNSPVVREAVAVWIASIIITLFAWALGHLVPWFYNNLGTIVALTFLFLPTWALWRNRIDISNYGFRLKPLGTGLFLFLVVAAITLPVFAFGFHVWNQSIAGKELDWSLERINQFPQSIQRQPESFQTETPLHSWVKDEQLWVLWKNEAPIQITVRTEPTSLEKGVSAHTIYVEDAGTLRQQSEPTRYAVKQDEWVWNSESADHCETGCGFWIPIADKHAFTLNSEPQALIHVGQWREQQDSPLTMERSWYWILLMFFVQLITVAIPEEWFFRCYLQQRLDTGLGTRWNIMGASLGWGWVLSSALFALGHLILDPRVERLAVFFPGLLFGWMFARSRSIVAPALMHALANVNIQVLSYMLIS